MEADSKSVAKKCTKKAEEDGYACFMNDTKWKELCYAFAAWDNKPAWRARDFLTGYLSPWDREWFYHVGPNYCSIEWLEIDPRDCSTVKIRDILRSVGIPFEESEYLKIFGYKKSRIAP